MSSRLLIAAAAAVLAWSFAAGAGAAPCRDAKGHFAACPAPAAKAEAERCRDAKGKFIACAATTRAPAKAAASAAATGASVNAAAVGSGTPTARCRDGSLSFSRHRSGTCARHGGVAQWMGG